MKNQEPTRLQYSLRAHLAALTEREHPQTYTPDEQDAHERAICVSTDEDREDAQ